MSIASQNQFARKTQAIKVTENQSQRWVCLVRLISASAFAICTLVLFLLGHLELRALVVQEALAGIVIVYSLVFLFAFNHKFSGRFVAYGIFFFDIVAVTIVFWSYTLTRFSPVLIDNCAFGVFLLVTVFAALHSRIGLPLFGGGLSIIGYSIVFFSIMYEPQQDFLLFLSHGTLIVVAATLGAIICRNNFSIIEKVISSELRYQNLIQRIPEMLFTLDKDGVFRWANNTAYTLFGIPAKILIGRNIKDFVKNAEFLKQEKGTFRGTFEIKDFNGVQKFVDCVIQVVTETAGDSSEPDIKWEGLMTDVSDREAAISQREEMVNRLHEYQKMESLATLASGMAHDFNNILQTISDLSVMTKAESKEPETHKRMNLMAETLDDARFLISELLALGRKKPLDYRNTNLQRFFEKTVPLAREQLGARFDIVLKMPTDQLWIQGDVDYLKRVFQNLFGNARDAMPGGGKITVAGSIERKEGEGNFVVIRVSDTGVGIPEDLIERIFDPFFSTKKPGKGTGLGLALVRRIVALHQGKITVEKSGRTGTTFCIEIPESEVVGVDTDTKAILLNRVPTTILLLDDDQKIRNILKFFLSEFGYALVEASDLAEGVAALQKVREVCNVVIMDWNLGTDNPHDVIKALRAEKPGVIVIVCSGYPPQLQSIKDMDIYKWFTKPYDKNQLDLEIQKALYYFSARKNRAVSS